MPIQRGFVKQIEVGRAGLVRVTLLHADASLGVYVIPDIDGDPERFNERLSKLAVLRDAMDRAEPVEIESVKGEAGDVIDRAVRISRDDLAPFTKIEPLVGFLIDLQVSTQNQIQSGGDVPDRAQLLVLSADLKTRQVYLHLQAPERTAIEGMLDLLQQAQTGGRAVRLLIDTSNAMSHRVVSVALDNSAEPFGSKDAQAIDGFVESLGSLGLPMAGGSALASSFAHVKFTTAPAFVGVGNVIGSSPYAPKTLDLLVLRGSPAYALIEAGLRDNVRMRLSLVLRGKEPRDPSGKDERNDTGKEDKKVKAAAPAAASHDVPAMALLAAADTGGGTGAANAAEVGLILGAELLAPLSSASRPVWIEISRQSLDHGPEPTACAEGTPSHDLKAKTLRDLHLPYPAKWRGLACFNEGVYRFQLKLTSAFTLAVDGRPLCVHDSSEDGTKLAYACLCGDHEVTVDLEAWSCEQEFLFDVYRIR